jgi:hypothetical protein
MSANGPEFTAGDAGRARDVFRDRVDSLENDVNRCFWPISDPGAPGPAFFPAVMYCFATLDYFSSFWAGWNRSAPQGENQTARMVAFQEKYLLYPRKESQIAIHVWRHKLMHTGEPRLLRDPSTNEEYLWSTGGSRQNHMRLISESPKRFLLHFCPLVFSRDLRDGVFGPEGYFHQLHGCRSLQENYRKCLAEFASYEITITP